MANQSTRYFHSFNLSTAVVKGVAIPRDGKPGLGTSLLIKRFPDTAGRCVNSSKERADSGRKSWKGHGDCLGRNRQ